jgi:hypothetical protein
VTIRLSGDHAEIRIAQGPSSDRGRHLVQALAGSADPGVTTNGIMNMTRGIDDDDPGLA